MDDPLEAAFAASVRVPGGSFGKEPQTLLMTGETSGLPSNDDSCRTPLGGRVPSSDLHGVRTG